ncbi:dCTP deaminase [Aphanizomenon phage vB_AphaS-CL131]|nr:dCTP deaminase [Aphanizomenon phage vB_AphaS-CL131]
MILNDAEITELAINGMITPFQIQLIGEVSVHGHAEMPGQIRKVISYGLSSYGYDIRLSSKEFKVFKHIPGTIVNPKNFNPDNLESVKLQHDSWGDYFIIPAHSYGLGVAIERLEMPPNLTAICIGKSTYARCFTGDTKVKLVNGDFTFNELIHKAESGERLFGFGVMNNEIVVQELTNPKFIEYSDLVRVSLDDGSHIDCTPDHNFLLRSGEYSEAQALKKGMSLRAIYIHDSHGYPTIYDSVKSDNSAHRQLGWTELHHMVWDCIARGGDVPERLKGYNIHHKDGNKENNHPSNLELISHSEHTKIHNQEDKRYLLGGEKFKELYESNQEFREKINKSLHSEEAKAKSLQALKAWRESEENSHNLSNSRIKRWSEDSQKAKQSEVAKKGIGRIKRRDDVSEQSVTNALLITGSIRGAARILEVDRSAFRRFPEILQRFKNNELQINHKVVKVEKLNFRQPTYCLTALETGNFALSSGVFVKNCGIIANLTPVECQWRGNLTIEISNSSSADCRVYANEGIAQLLFLRGKPCEVSYEDRQGKYQDQSEEIVLAKV